MMKLHGQFLRLHSRYGSEEETSITLNELALTLDCTHRNAMLIINNMVRYGWISWISSRGRGRRSTLRFLVSAEEIAVQSMMQTMNRKAIGKALDQVSSHTQSSTLQEHLQGWLLTYFGHHSEIRSDKQIDTLRLPVNQQLHTIDPLYTNLLAESFVASHVFDGLVRRNNYSEEIVPNLALAWEVDSSRKQWTFYLRKEVLFHNGRMLTADDVVYSLQRLIQTSRRTLYSFIFKQIKTVRALNRGTVRIELQQPNELFLSFLCTSRAAIVPRELEQLGEAYFGIRPIGTGPFKVTERSENSCVLEVFTHYFQGRAHLDRVEIVHVPWDVPADSTDYTTPFHLIHNPTSQDGKAWSQVDSHTSIRKFVTCNTNKAGSLSDPAVRAQLIGCLQEQRNLSIQELLPNNDIIRIATIHPYKHDAEFVATTLERHGYRCQVTSASLEEFKGSVRLESDLIVFSLLRDQDVQLRMYDLYLTMSEHLESHTKLDIEVLLHRAALEPQPPARMAWFEAIEELLIRENQLHILYEKPVQTVYLPSVRGLTFNTQGWVDLRTIWFPPADIELT